MDFQHLKDKKISYCEHFIQAFWVAGSFAIGFVKMVAHGIYPDVFVTTGSDISLDILKKTKPGLFKKEK